MYTSTVITRYSLTCICGSRTGIAREDSNGPYVRLEDHLRLLAAAENHNEMLIARLQRAQGDVMTEYELHTKGARHTFEPEYDGNDPDRNRCTAPVEPAYPAYVDCGNCPAINTGCKAGKCLRAAESLVSAAWRELALRAIKRMRAAHVDCTDILMTAEALLEAVRAPQPADSVAFDFAAHLQRQRDFSERTFGPGARVVGITDHIRKELQEVESSGGDLREWVDVIILALDGAWRSGASPRKIIDAIVAKQTTNEGRTWPNWRAADPNKAIEHDRTREADTHE